MKKLTREWVKLDVYQLAKNESDSCDYAELLMYILGSVQKAAALGPTCGSGAFLFAALNIVDAAGDEAE